MPKLLVQSDDGKLTIEIAMDEYGEHTAWCPDCNGDVLRSWRVRDLNDAVEAVSDHLTGGSWQ